MRDVYSRRMFRAGGSVAPLGSNEFIVGGIRYQLSDDKLAELRQGIGSDMSIFPIINAPGAQFGSEVEQALREYSRLREPFQLSEKFGEGFESRGEAFSDQDSVRPDSVLSAVQELARRGGSLAREYLIDPVIGFGGELFYGGGGEKGRKAALEDISSILGRPVTEQELALAKAQNLIGAEVASDVTFTPAAQQMLESQDFQRELDDLVGELNQAEQETAEETKDDASETAGEKGDAGGVKGDAGVEGTNEMSEEEKVAAALATLEAQLEAQRKAQRQAARKKGIGRVTKALSDFYEPGMTRAEAMLNLGKKLGEATDEEEAAQLEKELKRLENDPFDISEFQENSVKYTQEQKKLQESKNTLFWLDDAKKIIKDYDVTGLGPLAGEWYYKYIRAPLDPNAKQDPKSKLITLLEDIANSEVKSLLGESGRTISNLDRQIARTLIGEIRGLAGVVQSEEKLLSIINKRVIEITQRQQEAEQNLKTYGVYFNSLGVSAPDVNYVQPGGTGADISAEEAEEILNKRKGAG
jgi:hypothetical protein